MKVLNLVEELLTVIQSRKFPIVIYGAGWAGEIVARFLKNRNISVAAFTVTQQKEKYFKGIPVFGIDNILESKKWTDITIFIAAKAFNQPDIMAEIEKRKVNEYYIISELLQYTMIQELLKLDAEQAEICRNKLVGYLDTEYLGADYAQKRLIINKIKNAVYVKLPWEIVQIDIRKQKYNNSTFP